MKPLIYILLTTLLYSCAQTVENESRRFMIVAANNNIMCGFHLDETNDTLKLRTRKNDSEKVYKIIINNNTKERIIELFQYQFQIENFDPGEETRKNNNNVTFRISSTKEDFFSENFNEMESVHINISRNEDVSMKYAELIIYLKANHKEFEPWP